MHDYTKCQTQTQYDKFICQFATCWLELCHLPYFDICWMIVIDPMHNLLLGLPLVSIFYILANVLSLGLVKTHFDYIWILLRVL
jgi:hypothetical protein